jgi:hypothetical protein
LGRWFRRLCLRVKLFPWPLFLLASGALLALHWCAASSEKLLEEGEIGIIWFALGSLGLFLLLSLLAYWTRHTFQGVRSIAHHASAEQPKTSLVFCVSAQAIQLVPQPDGRLLLSWKDRDGHEKQLVLLRQSISDDIKELDKLGFNWPWQQLLRGLEDHFAAVRHVHLIGSQGQHPGGAGSHAQLRDCREFLAAYFRHRSKHERVSFTIDHPAQDFENFTQLADLFDRIIRHEREAKVPDRDIAIDITGGPKPISVAGAMATLNNDVAVQYVQTNPPKKAFLYALLYLAKPELH